MNTVPDKCPFCGSGVLSDWYTPISWFKCGTMILPDKHNRFDQSKRCVIAEVARLTDRIKRLEAAGDAMAAWLLDPRNLGGGSSMASQWYKAKEAKP